MWLSLEGVLYFFNNFCCFKLDEEVIKEFVECMEIFVEIIGDDFECNLCIYCVWELCCYGV